MEALGTISGSNEGAVANARAAATELSRLRVERAEVEAYVNHGSRAGDRRRPSLTRRRTTRLPQGSTAASLSAVNETARPGPRASSSPRTRR